MALQIQTLNTQAYDLIKEKILSNEILPGARLVDSQLAEEFGISRTPARDAVRKLAEEGLIITQPGKKGYFVYKPSMQDIDEIYELRQILDLAAAEKLITDILPKEPSSIELLKKCYPSPNCDTTEFLEYDGIFHQTMVEMCNNSRMMETYRQLGTYLHAFRSKTSKDASRKEKADAHHRLILEGLESLDLKKTQEIIRSHILLSKSDTVNDYSSVSRRKIENEK